MTITNATNVLTFDDNQKLTAAIGLPLSNQLGGILQALMVFKGTANIYQITGDISLGSGPPLGTLSKNTLNVATGTFAPNSPGGRTNEIRFNGADISQSIAPLGAAACMKVGLPNLSGRKSANLSARLRPAARHSRHSTSRTISRVTGA